METFAAGGLCVTRCIKINENFLHVKVILTREDVIGEGGSCGRRRRRIKHENRTKYISISINRSACFRRT